MGKKNNFFVDKYDCSIEGIQEEWEICDHCEWQDKVQEDEPPCCYCTHFDLKWEIPKDFNYDKLKIEKEVKAKYG